MAGPALHISFKSPTFLICTDSLSAFTALENTVVGDPKRTKILKLYTGITTGIKEVDCRLSEVETDLSSLSVLRAMWSFAH